MSTFLWWRSWHGAPTDHKWPVISVRSGVKVGIVSAIAWALMDYASQHDDRGSVEGFDTEMYAVYSGFEETEVVAVIDAMVDKGIILDGSLSNWKKRQPQREDNSTERVRQWRAKKRSETQCNANKSPDKDIDIDIEVEEDTEEDTEEDEIVDDNPMTNELGALEIAFTDATQLPGLSPSPQKAIDAYEKMHKAGVTAADIESAVTLLTDKEYTIIGPSSITNVAISEKLKRTKPRRGTKPMTSEERSKKYSHPGNS